MGFFGAADGWRGGGHAYPAMMKLGSHTLPKEYPKII